MTTTTYLSEITPFGSISLRDARPFTAEENGLARRLPFFPPPPTAFYHALRDVMHPEDRMSRQRREQGERERKATRPQHRVKQFDLRLRGLWLRVGDLDLFPTPADLRGNRAGGRLDVHALAPQVSANGVGSNVDGLARPGLSTLEEPGEIDESYMTLRDLIEHCKGSLSSGEHLVRQREILRTDTRIGVQLEGRKAQHGRLYAQQVATVADNVRFSALAEVDSASTPAARREAAVRLGGEARMAHMVLEPADTNRFDKARSEIREAVLRESDGVLRLKLVLTTPAIFSANVKCLDNHESTAAWRPHGRARSWRVEGVDGVRLVSAIVPRALPLGGWDHSHDPDRDAGPGLARPLYRCVPAGAVYFLEVEPQPGTVETTLDRILDLYWFRSILRRANGDLTYYGKLGFGTAVVGLWKPAGPEPETDF